MIDSMANAYGQMQPGDKMVMQLHKAQAPKPTYQMPGAPAAAQQPGAAAPDGTQPPPSAGMPQPTGQPPMSPLDQRSALIAAMGRMG